MKAAWGQPVIVPTTFLFIATTVVVVVFHMTIMTGHLQVWAWAIPWVWGVWTLVWMGWLSLRKITRVAHRVRQNRRWRRQFSDLD